MKRPEIKDKDVLKYVEYLEEKISNMNANTTTAIAYRSLNSFVIKASKVINDVIINTKEFSNKDDKLVERAQKFANELPSYVKDLKELEKHLEPSTIEQVKKESASLYEKAWA